LDGKMHDLTGNRSGRPTINGNRGGRGAGWRLLDDLPYRPIERFARGGAGASEDGGQLEVDGKCALDALEP
jgi:hypothetical protein